MKRIKARNASYVFCCFYLNGVKMYFNAGDVGVTAYWTESIDMATRFENAKPTNIPIDYRSVIFSAVKGFMAV